MKKVLIVAGGEHDNYAIRAVFDEDHREDAEKIEAYLKAPYPDCMDSYMTVEEWEVNPDVDQWMKDNKAKGRY